ncbi:MAG: chorismate mutase [Firmicutes bacterium]|nr:chorismate mutase [Bacillota bacterium]
MNNCCIRGAITAEENTRENILENTKILLEDIIR